MCTSDNRRIRRRLLKVSLVYLLASLFCMVFGAVYMRFSHEVYSAFMVYAFAFPLACGTLPFLLLALGAGKAPRRLSMHLYHAGIAALTVGSIMNGVLEIYGTTNALVQIYWVVGVSFSGAGILTHWGRKKG